MQEKYPPLTAGLCKGLGGRGLGTGRALGEESDTFLGAGIGRFSSVVLLTGVRGRTPFVTSAAGCGCSSSFSSSSSDSSKGFGGLGGQGSVCSFAPSSNSSLISSPPFSFCLISPSRECGLGELSHGAMCSLASEGSVCAFSKLPPLGGDSGLAFDDTGLSCWLRSGRPFWLFENTLVKWCVQTRDPASPTGL